MSETLKSDVSSFLTGTNAEYIAHLYNQFLINPEKISSSWKEFFSGINDNEAALLKELHGASWTPRGVWRRWSELG